MLEHLEVIVVEDHKLALWQDEHRPTVTLENVPEVAVHSMGREAIAATSYMFRRSVRVTRSLGAATRRFARSGSCVGSVSL